MSSPVVHFEIQADDINRAKEFYEKTFGWTIDKMMSEADGGMMDYWGLTTHAEGKPGINGGLYKRVDNKLTTFDCTIQVEDIDKAIEAVEKNGGKILIPKGEIPGVGIFARGQDTEGNIFGMMQATGWQAK